MFGSYGLRRKWRGRCRDLDRRRLSSSSLVSEIGGLILLLLRRSPRRSSSLKSGGVTSPPAGCPFIGCNDRPSAYLRREREPPQDAIGEEWRSGGRGRLHCLNLPVEPTDLDLVPLGVYDNPEGIQPLPEPRLYEVDLRGDPCPGHVARGRPSGESGISAPGASKIRSGPTKAPAIPESPVPCPLSGGGAAC